MIQCAQVAAASVELGDQRRLEADRATPPTRPRRVQVVNCRGLSISPIDAASFPRPPFIPAILLEVPASQVLNRVPSER